LHFTRLSCCTNLGNDRSKFLLGQGSVSFPWPRIQQLDDQRGTREYNMPMEPGESTTSSPFRRSCDHDGPRLGHHPHMFSTAANHPCSQSTLVLTSRPGKSPDTSSLYFTAWTIASIAPSPNFSEYHLQVQSRLLHRGSFGSLLSNIIPLSAVHFTLRSNPPSEVFQGRFMHHHLDQGRFDSYRGPTSPGEAMQDRCARFALRMSVVLRASVPESFPKTV
jgi:hypothetical protein